MPTIEHYLASLRAKTGSEYRTTYKYLQEWRIESLDSFADFLASRKLAQNTIVKHVRQARTLIGRSDGVVPANFGTVDKLTKDDIPPVPPEYKPYPVFTDADFQALYTAFNDADYPRFIIAGERQRYWQTIIHFISVTALRRQALLGIEIGRVNFTEFFVTVDGSIDKIGRERYKPITPGLANDILNLRRFYDFSVIPSGQHKLVFPWIHGDKKWYEVWNSAELKVGKRFHLHDLKRFSGELALRAGDRSYRVKGD